MSWNIVVFNLSKKVSDVEEIDESILVEVAWPRLHTALSESFPQMEREGEWVRIAGEDYSLETSLHEGEPYSNLMFHLYGEKAVYPLIAFCKRHGWQAFDTSLGEMLDLEDPGRNGYAHFMTYLAHVLGTQPPSGPGKH